MAAGVELATAWVRLVPSVDGISGAITKAVGGSEASGALRRGGKSMGAVLTGAIAGAAAMATSKAIRMVTGSIDSAIKRVDTMRNFPKMMENLGYSAKDAEKSIKTMSDRLKGLPTSLDSMAGMVQQLAPLTGGLGDATEISLALNNALLAGGKSTDIQSNAMEQYTKMLALGKVDMTSWRSMVAAMPGQMDQLSVALLGAGNKSMDLYEAMKDGTIGFDEFNAAMLDLNANGVGAFASFEKQARSATDGIATSQANLQTAIVRGLAALIDRYQPQIVGFISALTVGVGVAFDALGSLFDWVSANSSWLGPVAASVLALVGAYMAFKGTIAVINSVKAALAAWRLVQLGWNAATYGAAGASYAAAGAAKVGLVAHKAWNAVVAIGKGLWALMNGSLIKSAALWVANTAKIAAHRVAVLANNAGVGLWVKLLGMQLAAGWKAVAMWTRNTAALVANKAAMLAGTVASKAAAAAQWLFNAALNANPIMLVATAVAALVAGLVYFFTQTETGQQVWAAFTQFLSEAWENVSSVFVTVWESFLKPALEGLGAVASWLWKSILQPAFKGIGALIGWLWNNVAKPYFSLLQSQIKLVGAVFSWLYTNAVKPALDAIGVASKWVWESILRPVLLSLKSQIDTTGAVFRWLYDSVVKPVWDWISSKISSAWSKGIKPVIDTLVKVIRSDPKKAFEAARDAIGKAWAGIQSLAAKPVRFVVNTVINGLIGTINKIPGVNIPKVSLPKGFATGGILPGMSRMRDGDDQIIAARRGEGIMVSEALRTSADRAAFLAANAAGRSGVGFAEAIQGLRKGGLVTPLPKGSWSISQPYHAGHNGLDMAAAQGTPIMAAASGTVGLAGVVPMGGNEVYIQHGNGLGTRYSHLSRFASRAGQSVRQGQIIGYVGATGLATGPHLHYMVHNPGGGANNYGNHVNPQGYLNGSIPAGGEAWNPLTGLVDWVAGKVKDAFPGGGMWVDAAAGLAKETARQAVKKFTPKIGTDVGATLYDNGGMLPPGVSIVNNKTGRPEPVIAPHQWDILSEGLSADRRGDGAAVFHIYDRDNVLIGTIDGRIEDRSAAVSGRSLKDALGARN